MHCKPGIVLTAFLVFGVAGAQAQPQTCGMRDEIVQRLNLQFDEQRVGFGVNKHGLLMELFKAEGAGSWSVLITRPDGVSCLVDAGDGWQFADDQAKHQTSFYPGH